jgi:hypothetical protein
MKRLATAPILILALSLAGLMSGCGKAGGSTTIPPTPIVAPSPVELEGVLPRLADFGAGWIDGPVTSRDVDRAFCRSDIGAGRYVAQSGTAFVNTAATAAGGPLAKVRVFQLQAGTVRQFFADWSDAARACDGQNAIKIVALAPISLGDQSLVFSAEGSGAANQIVLVASGDYVVEVIEQVLEPNKLDPALVERLAKLMVGRLH